MSSVTISSAYLSILLDLASRGHDRHHPSAWTQAPQPHPQSHAYPLNHPVERVGQFNGEDRGLGRHYPPTWTQGPQPHPQSHIYPPNRPLEGVGQFNGEDRKSAGCDRGPCRGGCNSPHCNSKEPHAFNPSLAQHRVDPYRAEEVMQRLPHVMHFLASLTAPMYGDYTTVRPRPNQETTYGPPHPSWNEAHGPRTLGPPSHPTPMLIEPHQSANGQPPHAVHGRQQGADHPPGAQGHASNHMAPTTTPDHNLLDFDAFVRNFPNFASQAPAQVPPSAEQTANNIQAATMNQSALQVSTASVSPLSSSNAIVDFVIESTAPSAPQQPPTLEPATHSRFVSGQDVTNVTVLGIGNRKVTNRPPLSPTFPRKYIVFWAIARLLQSRPKGIAIRCFTRTIITAHRLAPDGAYKDALWTLLRRYGSRDRAQQLITDMSVAVHFVGCMVKTPRSRMPHYGIQLQFQDLCFYDKPHPERDWIANDYIFAPIT
ncbi:hypothetical protein CF326_g879 [Tilletia indica]|nr:hypothetical protein CF326_g879 [Tilletia indica]